MTHTEPQAAARPAVKLTLLTLTAMVVGSWWAPECSPCRDGPHRDTAARHDHHAEAVTSSAYATMEP
ncbi:hypothetical protein ACIBRY_34275 [Streptomyces anulatus]